MIWIVSSPERIHEEVHYLNELIAAEPGAILLRKPGWPLKEYAALLERLTSHSRIMIAGYPELLRHYDVMGFHMSESARLAGEHGQLPAATILSTSIHTPQSPGSQWQYLLLGPVFDSISKAGYPGKGHLFQTVPPLTIAIGGVSAANISLVRSMGFYGAALLGAIWNDPAAAVKNYQLIQQTWQHS